MPCRTLHKYTDMFGITAKSNRDSKAVCERVKQKADARCDCQWLSGNEAGIRHVQTLCSPESVYCQALSTFLHAATPTTLAA